MKIVSDETFHSYDPIVSYTPIKYKIALNFLGANKCQHIVVIK